MTKSHSPFLSVSRKKPRRCGRQDHSSFAPSSSATIWAILFSKPSSLRLEKGRLFGSPQTRRVRCVVGMGSAIAKAALSRSVMNARLRKREDIQHASLGRVLRQVLHCVDEAESARGVARVQIIGN